MKYFIAFFLLIACNSFADKDTVIINTIKTKIDTVQMDFSIGEITDSTIVIKMTPKKIVVEKAKPATKENTKIKKKKSKKKEVKK